jgi:hypothetical protein
MHALCWVYAVGRDRERVASAGGLCLSQLLFMLVFQCYAYLGVYLWFDVSTRVCVLRSTR